MSKCILCLWFFCVEWLVARRLISQLFPNSQQKIRSHLTDWIQKTITEDGSVNNRAMLVFILEYSETRIIFFVIGWIFFNLDQALALQKSSLLIGRAHV